MERVKEVDSLPAASERMMRVVEVDEVLHPECIPWYTTDGLRWKLKLNTQ